MGRADLWGYLFDLTGYDLSFIGAMVVGCINVAILMLFALRIRNRSQGLEVGDKTKNGVRLAVFVRC